MIYSILLLFFKSPRFSSKKLTALYKSYHDLRTETYILFKLNKSVQCMWALFCPVL